MQKTLILFIDAFSFSDLNEKNCPFIFKLAKDGVYGRLKTIPAGYHIEYSMLSGCLPLKHNVWIWYYLNPIGSFSKIKYIKPFLRFFPDGNFSRNFIDLFINCIRFFQGKRRFLKTNRIPMDFLEKLDISVDKMHFERKSLPVPNMFDVLDKKNIKYIGMEFPIFSNNKKTGFYFNKGDFKEMDKAINLLKKYDVVYLHVWNLDKLEHKYGLHSKEALDYIRKLDNKIKQIKNKNLRIVIFSDHGGVNIKKTRNILPILKKYDCDYFLGSTSVQIWLKGKDRIKDKKDKLKHELLKDEYLVYDENNIEKELFIPYKRNFVGDLLVWVKPGEQIYPDFFRNDAKVKSMHGYTLKVPELDGLFIMDGFGTVKKINEMNLYDIAPTILKAMKIERPKIWDGVARI